MEKDKLFILKGLSMKLKRAKMLTLRKFKVVVEACLQSSHILYRISYCNCICNNGQVVQRASFCQNETVKIIWKSQHSKPFRGKGTVVKQVSSNEQWQFSPGYCS